MSTLTLKLPEPLAEFVAEQAAKGGFRPEDYLLSPVGDPPAAGPGAA